MTPSQSTTDPPISPLESFVLDEVNAIGGAWDEIEPQVYDLLLPSPARERADEVVRITFDPDALAEHPRAQLASLGTPLVDQLLTQAIERGRCIELYLLGVNPNPTHLGGRVARSITLSGGLGLSVRQVRTLDFPQWVFWFEATFITDQREQEILPVAIDLHSGRQVRHLDLLLNESRLSELSGGFLPEVAGVGRAAAYRTARDQVLRTLAALANARSRELNERLVRQVARMRSYYDDLQHELDDQSARSAARGEADDAKYESRRAALVQERELRISELRRKSAMRAQLRLLAAAQIHQPKLQIMLEVADPSRRGPEPPLSVTCIWDPLSEQLEAPACAVCSRPTFELTRTRSGLACSQCVSAGGPGRHRMSR